MITDPTITVDMMIVLLVLVLVIILFIFELVRVDVVGLLMMVILPLTGVIGADEAISGLGSNAVVSIIAVIIIGAGLDKAGVIKMLSHEIIKFAGKTRTRIMIILSVTVAAISSFMQNIGAVSLFLPAATRISKQLNLPISSILMPMGFCGIIGGCLTLVGSSPLILLNDLMESWWINNEAVLNGKDFEVFGLFSVTPIGMALVVGIAASNTFILPTHQVNALIMRPGGYKTIDYVKAGTGMTFVFAAVVLGMLYFVYGIT